MGSAALIGAGFGFYLQRRAKEYYAMDIAAEVKRLVDEEEREERERLQRVGSAGAGGGGGGGGRGVSERLDVTSTSDWLASS